MRYILSVILCLVFTNTFAQSKKYDSLWKKVNELITKKGLPQSALTEVNKIYVLAKKDKQEAQIIKALVYKITLEENQAEDAGQQSIKKLEKETADAAEPSRSILYSLLAETYLSYFQQNRWKLYNRTTTVDFKKDDIATWSADDFHKKISDLYLLSIENEKLLQQTSLAAYDPIILKGNVRHLRPTLYDLLVHRALDYFRNDERDINRPAYAFEIKDPAYFAPNSVFAFLKLKTKDSSSLHYKALLLYQKLLLFRLQEMKNWDALVDVDIARIEFVNQYGVMENKDSLYLNALEDIATAYKKLPAATQAWYLIARWHADKAKRYDPLKDTSYRYEYITAKKICEDVIAQKDSSEGRVNCYNLLNEITQRQIKLTTEKVNVPGQPFRALVNYKNCPQVYFRIVSLTDNFKKQLTDRYSDNYWKQLIKLKSLRTWQQRLPITADLQEHNVEVKIDALGSGEYLLLASANENFSLDKNPLAAQYFYVSNISYINNDTEYFILNRETGKPLSGASVQTWWNGYDYNSRTYKNSKGEKYTVDKNGYIKITDNKERKSRPENLRLEITYGQDRLFMDDEQYIPFYSTPYIEKEIDKAAFERDNQKVFFFTDHSIYRPGQTVYFKGIIITKDAQTKKSKVVADHKTTIFLFNANYEKVDSLQVTTSEFGSYSGRFTIPENGLNGQFTIKDKELDDRAYFSVEEYKRPKFSVEYEPLKGTYKVNDSITVTGLAKAYAGNNIDGASVKYRVVRRPKFIYPWLMYVYGTRGFPEGNSMEITNGIATTNAEGKFTITFKAIPDLTINRQLDPIFDYEVTADITDINGETRSGSIKVPVSYKALLLKMESPYGEMIPVDSFKNINITTFNLNGAFQPAQVSLSIYSLQAPDRLIRKRYWEQPDQFIMSYQEYINNFPHDEYANETNHQSWNKNKLVFSRTDSTKANAQFLISGGAFTDGWYRAEAVTKDKYGQEVKNIYYFQLYNDRLATIPSPAYTWSDHKNRIIEPGEKSAITIGTSADDLFVVQQTDKPKNEKPVYNFINLNNQKKDFSFTATEDDRGGIEVLHFFVKHNRFYSISDEISIPWTNKELAITYETWRDKTLPGSEERWKIKINGYKKEKVAAEVLASLYDASLDQFKHHSWSKPDIWPSNYTNTSWSDNRNFTEIRSDEKAEEYKTLSLDKRYDYLAPYLDVYASANPLLALQGRVPGLFITQNTGIPGGGITVRIQGQNSMRVDLKSAPAMEMAKFTPPMVVRDGVVAVLDSTVNAEEEEEEMDNMPNDNIQIRKNFNETAFFLPDLRTDANGNIEFSFTMPEALTRWKFQALAHTKELAFGYSTRDIITQKELMVQPNMPRFLREGDKMELSAKVVNMTDKEINGTIQLQLLNATTLQPIDALFHNTNTSQRFTIAAGQSTAATFAIAIPYQFKDAIVYRFIAKAGNISDGEEASRPVLTNSMLVTESMPLPVRGNTTKNFRFEKLIQSANSNTLQQHALTIEYTSNPAWYAVQALPYLMEYPYECAEQVFNRFYANALATRIANSTPKLKSIFEKWKTKDTAALLSNLQKNQELKAVLLEETPWVLQAKNEAQQKKNIALLFDMVRMQKELTASLDKLLQSQTSNGGFSWFKGGPDDRYITQYIASGIGHLKKLDAVPAAAREKINKLLRNAIPYLDKRLKEDYDNLLKNKVDLAQNNLNSTIIQYMYMRTFFPEYERAKESEKAAEYYGGQSKKYWIKFGIYEQAMIAIFLYRAGYGNDPSAVIKSLKENAILNEETGMYWKQNTGGYYWHQAPIETQSLLIEAFNEIARDTQSVNDMKTWLLKQKQTQNWHTTKATADACYALLLQGSNWLSTDQAVEITVGDTKIVSTEVDTEAGTGYFKTIFDASAVKPSMGNITIKVSSSINNSMPSWGAVYWQYFENLDKITPAVTPLRLDKKLFIEKNTDRGPVLQPVNEGDVIKVGDKIKVRIELRVDRDMEYVHMKDMRAACMEPVNVISSYKWQGGLGYYESTKDASTNFFFNRLPKGTYVFEYPLFITATGNFSNGITSIQCMYAPEFSSHSEGIRVQVK